MQRSVRGVQKLAGQGHQNCLPGGGRSRKKGVASQVWRECVHLGPAIRKSVDESRILSPCQRNAAPRRLICWSSACSICYDT